MKNRWEHLRDGLTQPGEAALIVSDVNRFYLAGFRSSAGCVLVTRQSAYLLVDFRYGEAAKKVVKHMEVVVFERLSQSLSQLLKKHRVKTLYLESEGISVKQAGQFEQMLKPAGVKTVTDETLDLLLCNMRMIKSRGEILKIKEAQRITEEAYLDTLEVIKPGVTEKEIALHLEFEMRKRGASGVAFDLITITGTKTSLPHGEPGDTPVKAGDFVTMDIGAVFDGYHSDMTRTVAVGSATEEQKAVYQIVLEAQEKALSGIKAGITGEYADALARDVITAAGYGAYFGHSTGHGVGLCIHEEPRLSTTVNTILSSGMVVTVEPGIYLPGKFGVRIEDMVCITKNGCTNLTHIPKTLTIL